MNPLMLLSVTRLALGLIGLAAIATQLAHSIETGRSIVNFFSFFTIESNILAVVLLLLLAAKKQGSRMATFRGAVTLYMTMTGVIYALLLSGNEVALQTTIPWVNTVLHYALPVALLIDWLAFPPPRGVNPRRVLGWLAFPLAYVIYSLVRGGLTGWYPYPFLNVAERDLPTVLATSAIIAVLVSLAARLLAASANRAWLRPQTP